MADEQEPKDPATLYNVGRYWDNSDDAIIICPYDSTHKIRRYRIERHLVQCRKNHPDASVATCPFNAGHVIPLAVFFDHVKGCPDYRVIDPNQSQLRIDGAKVARAFAPTFRQRMIFNGGKDLPSPVEVSMKLPQSRAFDAAERSPSSISRSNGDDSAGSVSKEGQTMKERMKWVLHARDEKQFVEENVIVGGVPSLLAISAGLADPTPATELTAGANMVTRNLPRRFHWKHRVATSVVDESV